MTAVEQAIKRGLTPRAVEHAYHSNTTKQLAEFYQVGKEELTALAKRWGIGPYGEGK